jgi:hypothetical protein
MYQGPSKVDTSGTSGGTVHPLRLAEWQAENAFARHGGRKMDTKSDVMYGIAMRDGGCRKASTLSEAGSRGRRCLDLRLELGLEASRPVHRLPQYLGNLLFCPYSDA